MWILFSMDRKVILDHIWLVLNSKEHKWQKIQKALDLLEVICKYGSLRCVESVRDNMYKMRALTMFSYTVEAVEHGAGIRHKSKKIIELVNDEEMLNFEREKAAQTLNKFNGISNTDSRSMSSSFNTNSSIRNTNISSSDATFKKGNMPSLSSADVRNPTQSPTSISSGNNINSGGSYDPYVPKTKPPPPPSPPKALANSLNFPASPPKPPSKPVKSTTTNLLDFEEALPKSETKMSANSNNNSNSFFDDFSTAKPVSEFFSPPAAPQPIVQADPFASNSTKNSLVSSPNDPFVSCPTAPSDPFFSAAIPANPVQHSINSDSDPFFNSTRPTANSLFANASLPAESSKFPSFGAVNTTAASTITNNDPFAAPAPTPANLFQSFPTTSFNTYQTAPPPAPATGFMSSTPFGSTTMNSFSGTTLNSNQTMGSSAFVGGFNGGTSNSATTFTSSSVSAAKKSDPFGDLSAAAFMNM